MNEKGAKRYLTPLRRSFYVGENIEKEDVEATYRHGVLTFKSPGTVLVDSLNLSHSWVVLI